LSLIGNEDVSAPGLVELLRLQVQEAVLVPVSGNDDASAPGTVELLHLQVQEAVSVLVSGSNIFADDFSTPSVAVEAQRASVVLYSGRPQKECNARGEAMRMRLHIPESLIFMNKRYQAKLVVFTHPV
jgi:hypothetical protein